MPGMMLVHQDVRCTIFSMCMCFEALSPIIRIIVIIVILFEIILLIPELAIPTTERSGVGFRNFGTFRSWVSQLRNFPEFGFATSERSVDTPAAA